MNFAYIISQRISRSESKSFSSTINRIAVASIALGLAIMIVSFLILGGFRETIKEKIFSFGGHIQITKYTLDNSFEEKPISVNNPVYQNPEKFDFIDRVQLVSHKPALIKTEDYVHGVIIKGVSEHNDSSQFSKNIKEGRFIQFQDSTEESYNYSREILISRDIANTLELQLGDEVLFYFVQDPPRYRKLTITGIYETGLEDFDEKVVISDINLIRRLNNWNDTLVGGYEVYLKDFDQLDEAASKLNEEVGFDLYVKKINDEYVQIFDWLSLINRNVLIFLVLILAVACFNMVSILIILIMERTQMIGIFKALGATNRQIRRIFTYNGLLLIGKGMLWGNAIGLGFGVLQHYFQVIPLNPENYYMSFVPILWDFPVILLLNILTFGVVGVVLNIPTLIISRIDPIKNIRFD